MPFLLDSYFLFFIIFFHSVVPQIIYINESYQGIYTGSSNQPYASLKDVFDLKTGNFSAILAESNISCSDSFLNTRALEIEFILLYFNYLSKIILFNKVDKIFH